MRNLIDWFWLHAGGFIPYVTTSREVPATGAFYTIRLVWWRRSFSIQYGTPHTPRSERRRREHELMLLRARDRARHVGRMYVPPAARNSDHNQ